MSTAPAALRSEYFKVPNDLAEHMHLFPDAELRLGLITCRRQGLPISDRTWEEWTGRSARHKLNAVRGLQKKNILRVDGRGNSARYTFDYKAWSHYCQSAGQTEKPRTWGRAATVKTPIANAHPDCVRNGCMMARRQEGANPLTLVELRKPVSNSEAESAEITTDVSACNHAEQKPVTHTVATTNRKRVSNSGQTQGKERNRKPAKAAAPKTIAESENDWPLAFAMLGMFGKTALGYLCVLIPLLLGEFPDITDDELAEAMRLGTKPGKMKSPGLWQHTVPDQLRQIRSNRTETAARAAPSPPALNPLRLELERVYERYKDERKTEICLDISGLLESDEITADQVRAIDAGRVYELLAKKGVL
jgi:hypothetical protein